MISHTINKIASKIKITEYLAEKGFIPAKRSSNRYTYNSPLNADDKTPSFVVYEEEDGSQNFYCFSTKHGGTIINLIHKLEKKTFKDIVKKISEDANISVDDELNDIVLFLTEENEKHKKENKNESCLDYNFYISRLCNSFLEKQFYSKESLSICNKIFILLDKKTIENDLDYLDGFRQHIEKHLEDFYIKASNEK